MRDLAINPSVPLLLVEDDPDDVYLLRSVLGRSRLPEHLHVVGTGEDALRFLRRQPPYQAAPHPRLVLLDLRLPGISGLDVLRVMRQDADLRRIPVVILTASASHEDMVAAYDERARAFITKPGDRAAFEAAVERLEAFWLGTAQLPGV